MKHFAIVVVVLAVAFLIWYEGGGSDDSGSGDSSDPNQTGVAAIASALASFENVDPSYNNPDGICGTIVGGVCQGPRTYDTYADGLAAAESLIQSKLNNYPNWTVSQFIANWSGGTGIVLQNYITKVTEALGLDASEPISDAIK